MRRIRHVHRDFQLYEVRKSGEPLPERGIPAPWYPSGTASRPVELLRDGEASDAALDSEGHSSPGVREGVDCRKAQHVLLIENIMCFARYLLVYS